MQIEVIDAKKEAEREAVSIVVQAEAEKRRSAVKKNKTWNYCHNAVFSMYFLSHNFPFFRPRSHNPIIPHFFQFMTQRAKSARASSAARMRSTPSAGRVYTVIVLSLTSLTLTSFSSFHLFFFLCLTTPQCWSNVYGDWSFCYCSLSFDLFFVLSFVLVSLFDHFT